MSVVTTSSEAWVAFLMFIPRLLLFFFFFGGGGGGLLKLKDLH